MKKITILFLSVLTLGLSVASCSSDDDNGGASASIEGKWELIKEGTILNSKEELVDVENGNCGGHVTEYLTNGSFNEQYFEGSECESSTEKGTYSIKDKTLNLKYEGSTSDDSAEILELNGSTLKLKFTDGNFVYIEVHKRK